jgi:predicted permease
MVIGQVAMAVVLVVGAGLMLRSFSNLLGIDPGFDSKNVLTMRLYAPEAYYPKPGDVNGFYERVLNEIRRVPGVRNAGMVRVLPIDTEIGDSGVRIDGYVDPQGRNYIPADWQAASDGYFESMGMKLVEGRFFTSADRTNSEQVIIVNESFVQKYLGGKSGLDRLVTFGFVRDVPAQRVVGVVKNVKHNGLTGEVKPTFYRPQQQWPTSTGYAQRGMTLVLKGTIEPHRLMEPVRKAIGTIDPRLPVSNVKTMSEVLSGAVAQPRFTMVLLLVFGGLALTLALVGMYGVVSYAVAQRKQEMGIRMALGAAPTTIVWLAVRSGLVQTLSGIVLGVASAAALTRVMAGLMYQTTTRDPITYAVVTLLALAATGLASWIPARRAARTDPLTSLRSA